MTTLLATIGIAAVLFGGFCLALMLSFLLGRSQRRRCACAEAKRVGKLIEDRKKAARAARQYSPEKVDPDNLPIIDADLAGKHT